MENQKKQKNRKQSPKERIVFKLLSENVGMSISEARRQAGYSESSAKQTHRTTQNKAYTDILNEAGLTDEHLAQGHREASQAVEIRERQFIDKQSSELVLIDSDSPYYIKDGREKQFREETTYKPVSDQTIKNFFKNIPGAKLIRIEQGYRYKLAVYTVPQYTTRAKYYELGIKVKGHMAPERHDHHVVQEASEDEKKLINEIFNQNK